MKIAICIQCDKRMKELTNVLWCEGCDFVAHKIEMFDKTRKCQLWEFSETYNWWRRLPPFEKQPRKKK